MTPAALVRGALRAALDDDPIETRESRNGAVQTNGAQIVKITLRFSTAHALALTTRARAAEVSQGSYVAGLLDGVPASPLPPDHADAVAVLIGSTDQRAALGADLNAFMRLVGRGSSSEIERFRAGIAALAEDVRRHLAVTAPLVAKLAATRPPHGGEQSSTRSKRRTR